MTYKYSLKFKLISILVATLHIFVFCLQDAAVVFADEGEIAYESDTESVELEENDDYLEEDFEEDFDEDVDEDEFPFRDDGEDNSIFSSNNASNFNLGALQNVQPSLFTGALTYSIPISVPPGRKGIQPNIALTYCSQSGNGMLGMGWSLDLGSIERSTKRGVPNYDDEDTFIFKSGGSTSELVNIGGSEYRAKIEGAFMKFTLLDNNSWTVKDKSGTSYTFGQGEDSRQVVDGDIFKWCLDRVEDTLGNYMTIAYSKFEDEDDDQAANQIYPLRINYTGHQPTGSRPAFQVDFDYSDGERDDYFFSYRSGFLIRTNKLLQDIIVKYGQDNNTRIRKYQLNYEYGPTTIRARLSLITQYGYNADGEETPLPPITLTYHNGDIGNFER